MYLGRQLAMLCPKIYKIHFSSNYRLLFLLTMSTNLCSAPGTTQTAPRGRPMRSDSPSLVPRTPVSPGAGRNIHNLDTILQRPDTARWWLTQIVSPSPNPSLISSSPHTLSHYWLSVTVTLEATQLNVMASFGPTFFLFLLAFLPCKEILLIMSWDANPDSRSW